MSFAITDARISARAVAFIENPIFTRSSPERARSIARYRSMTSGEVSIIADL